MANCSRPVGRERFSFEVCMEKDCYTCRWAVCTAQGIICRNIWFGFPVDLLCSVPFPCDGWEKESKLVNDYERTI